MRKNRRLRGEREGYEEERRLRVRTGGYEDEPKSIRKNRRQ